MASVLGWKLAAKGGTNIGNFFSPYPQLNPPARNVARLVPLGTNNVVACSNQQAQNPKKFEQKTRSIREVFVKFLMIL
jgi:hypothetical protein